MKNRFASSIRLPLIASALALIVAGCGSMDHRSAERSVEHDRYAGQSTSPGTPPSIDAFSSSYIPFPPDANETAAVGGHSAFCVQHMNQLGCQTLDSAQNRFSMNDKSARHNRGMWRDPVDTGAAGSTYEPASPSRY